MNLWTCPTCGGHESPVTDQLHDPSLDRVVSSTYCPGCGRRFCLKVSAGRSQNAFPSPPLPEWNALDVRDDAVDEAGSLLRIDQVPLDELERALEALGEPEHHRQRMIDYERARREQEG